MSPLIVIGVVLAVLIVLALLHLKLSFQYDESGVSLDVRVWAIRVFRVPAKREKREKVAAAKGRRPKKRASGSLQIKKLGKFILEKVKRVPGAISIDRLRICFTVAGARDPFKAAMLYGGGYAFHGTFTALITNLFRRVKNYSYESYVDYTAEQNSIFVRGQVSIYAWQTVWLALSVLLFIAKLKARSEKQ